MSDFETSVPAISFSKNTVPSDDERQTANFRWRPIDAASCDGSAILVLPRPNIPTVPLARPFKRGLGAQEKRKREPISDPSTATMSSASPPGAASPVMVFSGKRRHVEVPPPCPESLVFAVKH